MAEADLVHSDITRQIIGAGMAVHSNLGPGFLENVYEAAMAIELDLRKVPYERQKTMPVMYKGEQARHFFCDFLVDGKVLVELKAIGMMTGMEEAQILNYLKITGLKVGLLMNFGESSLKYKRFVQG